MSWYWLLLIFIVTFLASWYKRKSVSLPPGPPGDPLIGHLRFIPPAGQDMYFYKLGLKYGDVVHLKFLGRSLVILNSAQAAADLLDKRGANTSDRPYFPIYSLMGWSNTLPLENYGPQWRRQRTMVQQYLSKEKCKQHHLIQTREAHTLALNLLEKKTTEDCSSLFIRFSTAVIIDIAYGHRLQSSEDPYLKIADECSQVLANSGPPAGTPVDLFPILRYFPSWFPGTHYATYARNGFPTMAKLFDYPYDELKAKGPTKPSFLASLLDDLRAKGGEEDKTEVQLIKYASGSMYFGGAETTASTLSFFLLAMVLYPEVQVRAQEEIDRVVDDSGRLPELVDRERLLYLECILQETLRWHQPLPTGFPHKSMKDEMYNDMLIPKGSVIIANARAMTLNEAVYKHPFTFDPTRFLPSPEGRGEPFPTGQFGFGRRICPGRYLAEDSLWIAIATILATMKISKAIGKDGKEIIPEESVVTAAVTIHPSPFSCVFKPRNREVLPVLKQLVESA